MISRLTLLFVSLGFPLACAGADPDPDPSNGGLGGQSSGVGGQDWGGYAGEGTGATPGSAGSAAGGSAGSPDLPGSAGAPSGTGGGGGGSGGAPPTTPNPSFTAEMVYTTVNIGREYATKADVQAVIDKVGDVVGSKTGPKFIGWQEISEDDPCGNTCEIDSIHSRFPSANGWTTNRPAGKRPDGGTELVKVPITSKGSNDLVARAEFASPGWSGVSPTRFVTVVRYKDRGLAVLNTHFIAGAWSCKSNVAKRKDYWQAAWKVLKTEVAKEHDLARNVIVTGDLNRPRAQNSCNPAWDPESLHAQAKIVGGENIDYIFAVPADGNKFVVSTQNGAKLTGSIGLGIDGHKGHWVIGRFLDK